MAKAKTTTHPSENDPIAQEFNRVEAETHKPQIEMTTHTLGASVLQKAIDNGIPLNKVQFHAAVNNADSVPENYFSSFSEVKSRRVEMWLTNVGFVFKQKNTKGQEIYFGTPTANVIFHFFK